MSMRKLATLCALIPAVLLLSLGTASAARPRCSCPATVEAAVAPEIGPVVAAALGVAPGTEAMTPVPAARPPEDCPGEFDTSRPANFDECTLAACHQWCIEDGGSFAAFEIWISLPPLCLCKCCE